MHEIDLKNKNVRCDLIKDSVLNCNIELKTIKNSYDDIIVEKLYVDKKMSRHVNKKIGNYISITFDDVTDYDKRKRVIDVLSLELSDILKKHGLFFKSSLVVGLGNIMSTPDSLGPKTLDGVLCTRYLFSCSRVDSKYSCVSKIAPGVFATTGIESFDIIKGIVKIIKPDFVIVIDSLASISVANLCKVIQITDSGIDPGSGVGNSRKEISKKTLGVDVIAIGVPTVVDSYTLINDLSNSLANENYDNFFVTPKEIDFTIEKLSLILSKAINNSLHIL